MEVENMIALLAIMFIFLCGSVVGLIISASMMVLCI
ncbi:Uncharacterised protein [uncultured Clostridium sp.]|nr:Uncharacterised protein [uncultured Clostridium sp.]